MYKMGIVGEEVIGKEVGSSPGFSHSPPITILISFTVAGFRPLPSQVCIYIYIYIRGQGMDNKKDFSVAMSVGFSGTFSKEQTSARPSRLGRHCW